MDFIIEISVGDILSFISIFGVFIGGVFAFFQYKKSVKLKRADYINDLTEKIRTDPDISESIYLLDYSEAWYNHSFHNSFEKERKMDKTLSYFAYICYLKKQKLISKKEFFFFKYEVERILMNRQIQDYFYNLYHFSSQFDIPITFKYLFEYGEKNHIFNSLIYNKDAYLIEPDKFHRYLNICS